MTVSVYLLVMMIIHLNSRGVMCGGRKTFQGQQIDRLIGNPRKTAHKPVGYTCGREHPIWTTHTTTKYFPDIVGHIHSDKY